MAKTNKLFVFIDIDYELYYEGIFLKTTTKISILVPYQSCWITSLAYCAVAGIGSRS